MCVRILARVWVKCHVYEVDFAYITRGRESIYMWTYMSAYMYWYKTCIGMKSAISAESSPDEKHLRALVDETLRKIHLCMFAVQKANIILVCIQKIESSRQFSLDSAFVRLEVLHPVVGALTQDGFGPV